MLGQSVSVWNWEVGPVDPASSLLSTPGTISSFAVHAFSNKVFSTGLYFPGDLIISPFILFIFGEFTGPVLRVPKVTRASFLQCPNITVLFWKESLCVLFLVSGRPQYTGQETDKPYELRHLFHFLKDSQDKMSFLFL